MKLCTACSLTLPKANFSKKQWQQKQRRRCKECIAENREVEILGAPDDAPPLPRANAGVTSFSSDEDLFKEPSERGECPICFLPRPLTRDEETYFSCCGKTICDGCLFAGAIDNRRLCPYCRGPQRISEGEFIERLKKRAEAGDADGMRNLAGIYHLGSYGLPQNYNKANKLLLRAGKLGCAGAYHNLAVFYENREGVERDTMKAKYYYELGAMGGDVSARYNLGHLEKDAGNVVRAMKHWMMAAGAGHDDSLKCIRFFMRGEVTKDDFEKALRAHKYARDEMKSDQREAAAALCAAARATSG